MDKIPDLLAIAIQNHQAGQLEFAESVYRQILERDPNHADALHLLGVIAHQVGNPAASVDYIRQAIQRHGDSAVALSNLGIAYQDLGQIGTAIDCFRRALQLNPLDTQTCLNLGVALKCQGLGDEAMTCYQQVLRLNPGCAEVHNNLGIEFHNRGQLNDAVDCYHRALELQPDYTEVHSNLGNALKELGLLDDAIERFRRAIELKPDYAEAHNNLGNALKDQGRLDQAIASYRQAVTLNAEFIAAHDNLVYSQIFSPNCTGRGLLEEHERWAEQHAVPIARSCQPYSNERSLNRRLRIGYVSPDFRDHCQAFFTTPLFRSHDRTRFEIYCYADVARPDQITERLRGHVDTWRDIVGFDDAAVAALIRQDQIDILVDLTMHMAGNRLLVFARKPAPIQICWLAYPGTTGLTSIDYRLTDPYLDPPFRHDDCYSEESLRLPDTFWCYDPLTSEPQVQDLPAQANGFVTFGCLNNLCKVNAETLQRWALVLKAVDRSRLIILAPAGRYRQKLLDVLSSEGVAEERVTFVTNQPRPQYLQYYHKIDIGLDTLPYNGHTTSLDAFWMGVPVVTLVGDTVVGRAGLCQLMNLELSELIAECPEHFVAIAASLAHDLPRLKALRTTLRQRMQASPLMDAARFARNIEAVYHEIWQRWCAAGNKIQH